MRVTRGNVDHSTSRPRKLIAPGALCLAALGLAANAGANTSNLRCLIASLVAAGAMAEASKFVQHLMQFVPNYRLATFRARTPLRGEVRDLFAHRLSLAGVPD